MRLGRFLRVAHIIPSVHSPKPSFPCQVSRTGKVVIEMREMYVLNPQFFFQCISREWDDGRQLTMKAEIWMNEVEMDCRSGSFPNPFSPLPAYCLRWKASVDEGKRDVPSLTFPFSISPNLIFILCCNSFGILLWLFVSYCLLHHIVFLRPSREAVHCLWDSERRRYEWRGGGMNESSSFISFFILWNEDEIISDPNNANINM